MFWGLLLCVSLLSGIFERQVLASWSHAFKTISLYFPALDVTSVFLCHIEKLSFLLYIGDTQIFKTINLLL